MMNLDELQNNLARWSPSTCICAWTQTSQVALPLEFQEPAQEFKKHADTPLEVKC